VVCILQGRDKSLASAENWIKIPKMSSPLHSHYTDYTSWLAPTCIVPRCNHYHLSVISSHFSCKYNPKMTIRI
jgi:hypothetical protein